MPVVTTLPQPGVERRWQKLPGEPDGPGGDPYTGYDQFGRTVQMRWFKVSGSPETYDPLVSVAWGYNRASLKLWRQDLLAPTLAAQDQLFSYDGLYQVSERERGVLNTGHTGITGTPAQAEGFEYDETGNWVTYQQNNAGVLDIDQTRENNVSNQITEIDSSSAGVSYDLNGNMLLVPTGESLEGPSRQLVWDAWNRLRIVKDHEDTVLGEYHYDGQTRRTTSAASGAVRHFYYNDQWRSVEERLDAASTAESQYVWHPTDRWELLLRDRSTENNGTLDERLYSLKDQLDPVAVCDDDGAVVERYAYSAFGLTSVLDAEFESEVASPVAWSFLFHGEFRDTETAWYNYGYRYYGAELGRWLSRDPIESIVFRNHLKSKKSTTEVFQMRENALSSLYIMVRNGPPNAIDVEGLAVQGIAATVAIVLDRIAGALVLCVCGCAGAIIGKAAYSAGYDIGRLLADLSDGKVDLDHSNMKTEADSNMDEAFKDEMYLTYCLTGAIIGGTVGAGPATLSCSYAMFATLGGGLAAGAIEGVSAAYAEGGVNFDFF